ncbi:MAG TPA: hypothetical protein ENI72_02320 [Rhodospirillales bacterium]|nr:hypothetical protein [Rhodospirillales bacterium]
MKSNISDFYEALLGRLGGARGTVYISDESTHTYPEMYEKMERINGFLKRFGNERVALLTDKNLTAYAAIYAIVLSGNCWLPVNPDLPVARQLAMLKLARPKVILSAWPLTGELAAYARAGRIEVALLGDLTEGEDREPFNPSGFHDDDLAYIMFTSGSTGVPKGVPMTHANYINFINTVMNILPFEKGDVFSDYHDFGFDLSIFYLFCCPLCEGAFAPALTDRDRLFPVDHIKRNKVSVLSSVPSLISRVMAYGKGRAVEMPVRILFMCGEPFRIEHLEFCYERLGLSQVHNFYGLTETGVENFHHACSPEDIVKFRDIGYVPIGKPLPGNHIRVTGQGELWLSGSQVTPGYLGGVSSDRFAEKEGTTWFRTGDKVVEKDGVYFCKGRLDQQVKLNGYRIELMDIEAHLRQMEGVREAVCFLDGVEGREFLVAGLSGSNKTGREEVRDFLANRLPGYMVPGDVFVLGEAPLNQNGKVDRAAVRRLYEDRK